jgi:hypothetical protein
VADKKKKFIGYAGNKRDPTSKGAKDADTKYIRKKYPGYKGGTPEPINIPDTPKDPGPPPEPKAPTKPKDPPNPNKKIVKRRKVKKRRGALS